jgi:hypothetical protein
MKRRKGSGSYYTPDDLVNLIIKETIDPLVSARLKAFADKAKELEDDKRPLDRRLGMLTGVDPAEKLLEVKICDPAMGSGHFLVALSWLILSESFTLRSSRRRCAPGMKLRPVPKR